MATGRLMVVSEQLNIKGSISREGIWKQFLLRANTSAPLNSNISTRGVLIHDYNSNRNNYLPLSKDLLAAFLRATETQSKQTILQAYKSVWDTVIAHCQYLVATKVMPSEDLAPLIAHLQMEVDFCVGVTLAEYDGQPEQVAKAQTPTLFPQTLLHRLLSLVAEETHEAPAAGQFYYKQRKLANLMATTMLSNASSALLYPPASLRIQRKELPDLTQLQKDLWAARLYNALKFSCVHMEWKCTEVGSAPLLKLPQMDIENLDTYSKLVDIVCDTNQEGSLSKKTVMVIADRAGEIVFDLNLVDTLISIGHRVVLCVNSCEVFDTVASADFIYDKMLAGWLKKGGRELLNYDIPLLHRYIYDNNLDGCIIDRADHNVQHDIFDPFKGSNNFFRAARMAEVIIAKERHFSTLGSLHTTRDIFWLGQDVNTGAATIAHQEAHTGSRLITRSYIEAKATHFITFLQQRKSMGWKVVFGSVIIGSLGESKVGTCIRISKWMEENFKHTWCYKKHLRAFKNVFYINPATGYTQNGIFYKFFESGFDGDAMMEFWSQVQMSGLVDVWRFQSKNDIISFFEGLPTEQRSEDWQDFWADKNWTVSKGCCQEMLIARYVKRKITPNLIIFTDDEDSLNLTDAQLQERSYYHIGSIS